jgi:hypothetical protein
MSYKDLKKMVALYGETESKQPIADSESLFKITLIGCLFEIAGNLDSIAVDIREMKNRAVDE